MISMEGETHKIVSVNPAYDSFSYGNEEPQKSPNYKKDHSYIKYVIGTIIVLALTVFIVKVGYDTVENINTTQSTIKQNFAKAGYKIFEDNAERNMAMIAVLPFMKSGHDDVCHYIHAHYCQNCKYIVNKEAKTVSLYDINSSGDNGLIYSINY